MASKNMSGENTHIYRVDKFIVPEQARSEFFSKVVMTHELLKKQPGFVQDRILELTSGPGEFNIITLVEWESMGFIDKAKAAVTSLHQQVGFNPQELFRQLRIKADLGYYQEIEYAE